MHRSCLLFRERDIQIGHFIVLTIIRHRNGRDTVARHCYTRKSQPLFDLAALFTLDAVFVLTETGVTFQEKRVRSAITSQSTDVGDVFKLRGEFWQATFAGETRHFKDVLGMKYIARLLSEPHKDLANVTLQSLQFGIDPLVIRGRLSAGFARVCGCLAADAVSLPMSRTTHSIHKLGPPTPHSGPNSRPSLCITWSGLRGVGFALSVATYRGWLPEAGTDESESFLSRGYCREQAI